MMRWERRGHWRYSTPELLLPMVTLVVLVTE